LATQEQESTMSPFTVSGSDRDGADGNSNDSGRGLDGAGGARGRGHGASFTLARVGFQGITLI
jgi:hypothetical protein